MPGEAGEDRQVGRFLVADGHIVESGDTWGTNTVHTGAPPPPPGAERRREEREERRRGAGTLPVAHLHRAWTPRMEGEDSGYLSTTGGRGVREPAGLLRSDTMLSETARSLCSFRPRVIPGYARPRSPQPHPAPRCRDRSPVRRVVGSDGMTNVSYKNISKKRRRYFSDFYTTLLDASWSYCVIILTTSFYGSWLLFGSIYFLILFLHGDLEDPMAKIEKTQPCFVKVTDFSSCFLFSLETQHTIGYGTRQPTTECPHAVLVVSLQSVLGCLIQAFMVGLVFSKLSRPSNRSKTIIFSSQAVINMRNRKLCLVIRIGDVRRDNFILGTQISVKLLRRGTTQEGELYQEMTDLRISPQTSSESCTFFVWPLDIVHMIDKDSPFYHLGAADLATQRFELVVVMEGTSETSNTTFQARTSYLPHEIQWGQRFEQMLIYRKDQNKFQVNFSAFHSTYEVDTPLCSARTLEQVQAREEGQGLGPAMDNSSAINASTHQDSIHGEFLLRSVSRSGSQGNFRKPSSTSDSPFTPLFLPDQKVTWTLGDSKAPDEETAP